MTENQLKVNDDKTEALLFPFSSSLKSSTVSLPDSITLGSHNIPFSDSARNLGVILDKSTNAPKTEHFYDHPVTLSNPSTTEKLDDRKEHETETN